MHPKGKYYQGFFNPLNPTKYIGDPRKIVYRSSWELRAMVYLDTNNFVLQWKSEEIAIPYVSPRDKKVHRYFPDFWAKIQTKDGVQTFLVEVKPESQIQPPKRPKKVTRGYVEKIVTYEVNQAKWESAKKYCQLQGWQFITLNEYELGVKT